MRRMVTREELQRLVSSLPESALAAAHACLTQVQPESSAPSERDAALERFREAQQLVYERLQQRMQWMRQMLDETRRDS
jgi:hypothetical protein